MGKVSAGVLPFRLNPHVEDVEVLLVHPGGPLWAGKEAGAWSIAKGELEPGELPLAAAVREFAEETGWRAPGPYWPLGAVTQKSGKVVHGFATPFDVDPATLVSGTFTMEWPRGSGMRRTFPEVDRAAWCGRADAAEKLNPAQLPFVERLIAYLRGGR